MARRREDITELLRQRVLGALSSGTLSRGDRLPSTRELAAELEADPRVVLAAYRTLAADGLVELRPRSGIYVAAPARAAGVPILSAPWIVEILAQAVARDIPAVETPNWFRLAIESVRLRAFVAATTIDQVVGMVGELRDGFGVEASGLSDEQLRGFADGQLPAAVRRADLVVTTQAMEATVRAAVASLGVPIVVAGVRTDLIGSEWRTLLAAPTYVVVCDARFGYSVREFFSDTPGSANLRVVVLGRDDPSTIPGDATVYLTRAAREHLAGRLLPGRIVESARVFDAESVRAILDIVVRANLAALERRGGVGAPATR